MSVLMGLETAEHQPEGAPLSRSPVRRRSRTPPRRHSPDYGRSSRRDSPDYGRSSRRDRYDDRDRDRHHSRHSSRRSRSRSRDRRSSRRDSPDYR